MRQALLIARCVIEDRVTKALDLIQLYADTVEAQEPRRQALITQTLEDLERLCDRAKAPS